MAIVQGSKTLLPLDTWAKLIGYNPLHFNGVEHPTLENQIEGNMIVQFNWQNADSSSREEIASIIAEVESLFIDHLRYTPAPAYVALDKFEYPRPRNPDLFSSWGFDVRGMWRRVPTKYGYPIQGGIEQKTLAQAGASIVYTDVDNDGYKETATIGPVGLPVFPIPISDPSEVAIYYPGHQADDHYEIRPTTVTLDTVSNRATIVCRREQLVGEVLLFGYAVPICNGSDDSSFLTTVDVYRHWCDPQQMCTFIWDQIWLAGQFSKQVGVLTVENADGFATAQPGTYDPTMQVWNLAWWNQLRMPDRVELSYKAGWPLDPVTNQMDNTWARPITYLSLAMLDRPLEGPNAVKEFTNYWSDDRGQNSTDRVMLTSRRKLDNPLGTSRAAIYCWDRILRGRLGDKLQLNAQI